MKLIIIKKIHVKKSIKNIIVNLDSVAIDSVDSSGWYSAFMRQYVIAEKIKRRGEGSGHTFLGTPKNFKVFYSTHRMSRQNKTSPVDIS